MLTNKHHREAGRSLFMSSAEGLAKVLAMVAAFLGTPWLYEGTIGFIQEMIARSYGHGWTDFASIIWFCLCAGIIYFTAQATIGTALIVGAFTLATRFL